MRITKRQLKRIIKEEKTRLVKEQAMAVSGDAYWELQGGAKNALSVVFQLLDQLRDGEDAWEIADKIEAHLESFAAEHRINL